MSLIEWSYITTQDQDASSPEYRRKLAEKLGVEVKYAPSSGNRDGIVLWRTEGTDEQGVNAYLQARRDQTHGRVFMAMTQGPIVPEDQRHVIPPDSVDYAGF